MVNRLKSKIPGLLLAVVLLALLISPVMAANEFEIKGANVYSGYLEENDWLIVIEYHNVLEPYFSNETSVDSFQLQLVKVDNTTLIAQTPLPAWGWKPGAIYLSATTVASLEWGSAYVIKLVGVANTTIYTLVAADWRGSDLAVLDAWCMAVATRMETYYNNATFIIPSADATTNVLNINGSVEFILGIPYLDQIRPNIFQVSTYSPDWETDEWTGAYETTLPGWEAALGPNLVSIFNATGAVVNLEGKHIGAVILFIIYFAIALGILGTGHGTAGLVLALPILIPVFYWQLVPLEVLGVIVGIAAFFLIRQLWWKTT